MGRLGKARIVRRSLVLASVLVLNLVFLQSAFADSAWGSPKGITDEAKDIHNLYLLVLALGFLVFLVVEGGLLWILFRYRRKSPDELPRQTHGSTTLELIWTGIPVLIVVTLFTTSFIVYQDVREDPSDNPEYLTVDVTGFQFQWQFDYALNDLGEGSDPNAEGNISIIGTAENEPELVIPVDEPIEFKLISNDVIHSFYVVDFNYKLDVIPGQDNRFKVTARETGVFHGQCAELCGVNHALMRFTIRVVERAEFDDWVAEQSGGGASVRQTQ